MYPAQLEAKILQITFHYHIQCSSSSTLSPQNAYRGPTNGDL